MLKSLSRQGTAVEISPDHFFLRETVSEMVDIAADIAASAADGQLTAAQFRDRMDNGRKVAIQILEFFDRHGVTVRRGDLRRVNKQRLDLFRRDADGDPPAASGGESSRWDVRTSNPGGAVSRSLVGSNFPLSSAKLAILIRADFEFAAVISPAASAGVGRWR